MAQDIKDLLREIFGDQIDRFSSFQSDQLGKLTGKIQELAREALKPDLAKLQSEISELRARVVELEAERATAAADGTGPVI
jgi:polyhydroxyalkanoate synthesis regulator phasin